MIGENPMGIVRAGLAGSGRGRYNIIEKEDKGGTVMKILLIEDDADIAAFLSMELEHEDYAVSVERDGPNGLQAARI